MELSREVREALEWTESTEQHAYGQCELADKHTDTLAAALRESIAECERLEKARRRKNG